jgi:uncharacterized membrane protein
MFKKYDSQIKQILSEKSAETDWGNLLENHKEMTAKIQHERLIHLLVMIFVGVVMSISFFAFFMTKDAVLLFIFTPLLFLFIGYIFHYRFLENTTQNWYVIEEEIKKRG